uniref:Uncharacterized protein n=1 Tax=Heterorhabditis bacteriophora TaxID=37862 RepID=A0A1I7WEI4_HETBA
MVIFLRRSWLNQTLNFNIKFEFSVSRVNLVSSAEHFGRLDMRYDNNPELGATFSLFFVIVLSVNSLIFSWKLT